MIVPISPKDRGELCHHLPFGATMGATNVKLVSFLTNNVPTAGLLEGDNVIPLQGSCNEVLASLPDVPSRRDGEAGQSVSLSELTLLPCVPAPEKIICIGLNYADHAKESGAAIPAEPVVFSKFATALRGHGDEIVLPTASDSVDYEAELVVVIGKKAKLVTESEAMNYVAGYTCGHDVSARDWQKHKPGGQWLCGKSFDSFAPIGPHFVSADEVPDPHNLRIQLRLNGQTMQDSNTKQLIFNVPQLIAYLSQVCTLKPGDLIFTGTPPGVGAARKPPVFLKHGDVAEVEIEGLGTLRNPVVQAAG